MRGNRFRQIRVRPRAVPISHLAVDPVAPALAHCCLRPGRTGIGHHAGLAASGQAQLVVQSAHAPTHRNPTNGSGRNMTASATPGPAAGGDPALDRRGDRSADGRSADGAQSQHWAAGLPHQIHPLKPCWHQSGPWTPAAWEAKCRVFFTPAPRGFKRRHGLQERCARHDVALQKVI